MADITLYTDGTEAATEQELQDALSTKRKQTVIDWIDANCPNLAALKDAPATAGKFDELALALTQRMEVLSASDKRRRRIDHNHLDTAALANFLNGNVEKAISLQKKAIGKNSSSDFRRRLRTYEAARTALAKAQRGVVLPTATMIAANNEDEE